MTRTDLESAVYRRLDKNDSSIDSATQTRVRHFLNQRHRRILSLPGMAKLRDTTTTVASVIDQASYSVTSVSAIHRVFETTNDRVLMPISMDEYRRRAPDASAYPGTPEAYALQNHAAGAWTVFLHPRPTAVITYTLDITSIVSDFASDSAVPLLPDEFHYLLELGASMDELVKTDDPRYTVWAQEYADGINDLKYWIAKQSGSNTGMQEFSRLGSYFPAWRS